MSEQHSGPSTAQLATMPRGVRQLLALCPLIAVTDTAVGALGLGSAALLSVAIATLVTSFVRRWLAPHIRFIATVLIVAGVLAGIGLAMTAWMPGLTQTVGVFLALLASNVVILTMVEGGETSPPQALWNAKLTSVDILVMLFILGVAREIVGRGSLFTGAGRLFGESYAGLEVALFRLDMGFLLALLPPGAFIAAGLLVAVRRLADSGRRTLPE